MIRLGLRLTLKGGREAIVRLIVTALAVAIGVGMLLITLAGINAVNSQNARYAWLETGSTGEPAPATATATARGTDPLWWLLTADEFHGQIIGRIDIAATGNNSPAPPPGIPHLPGPGQFYASPALSKLLRSVPTDELGARYPGTQIGTLGASALPSPSSLLIIIGRSPAQLEHVPGATTITSVSRTVPSSCNGSCAFIGINASGIDLILSVTSAALLFPVLIFIGTSTRLSAARREQRFAAMRLVGATPGQVSTISAVESGVAAAAGVIAGFVLFFLLRPTLAGINFTGSRFFLSDLSLNLTDVLLVAISVPVAAIVAARLALRRVRISPLGVSRRTTPKPPRAYRLIPLLVGIAELSYFVFAGRPRTSAGQTQAYLPGILVIMAGLVIAGPWLTMVGARVMVRRTSDPAVLIAGRRVADNPQAAFRAISGLVLALFVTSTAIGVITTIDAYSGRPSGGSAIDDTLIDRLTTFTTTGVTSTAPISTTLAASLRSIPGVQALTTIHTAPGGAGDDVFAPGVVSCDELARTPVLGRCPAGTDTVTITARFDGRGSTQAGTVWPAAAISSAELQTLPAQSIVIATNGSAAAIERARTTLELAYPYLYQPATIAEQNAQNPNTRLDAQYQQLVDVVILTSLPIAGCSLVVSIAAGLSDRKRPFSLLRLAGAPINLLRRVVALESAAPLLVIAVISIGTGFLAAGLFLRSQLSESLQPPGLAYYLILAAGLAASITIIASTFPLLQRITGPEIARNE